MNSQQDLEVTETIVSTHDTCCGEKFVFVEQTSDTQYIISKLKEIKPVDALLKLKTQTEGQMEEK